MDLIRTATELAANIDTFRDYALHPSGEHRAFAVDLAARDDGFVVTRDKDGGFFTPVAFVATPGNSRERHAAAEPAPAEAIEAAVERILGRPAATTAALEEEHAAYRIRLGLPPRDTTTDSPLRFWDLR